MADFMRFPTEREKVLTSGNTTIGIIPEICLVTQFQVGDWRVLYRPDETGNVKRWGLPLMIPNFSRLKDGIFQEKHTTLPIHGFGRTMPWTVTEEDGTRLSMQLRSSDVTRADYPYEFTFTATIEAGEGTLTYTVTMENRGDETMPIAPGFHPFFAVAQEDKSHIVTDGPPGFRIGDYDWVQNIPDKANPFPHRVTVQIPHGGTLTIEEIPTNDGYALKNMQVWSDLPTRPDHDFVCFEPTVSSEDALNRPADRLNIAPRSSRQFMLRLTAQPVGA
ncbi:MAG: aldose epimerase family protein [Ktedonobacteraceae bacterium]